MNPQEGTWTLTAPDGQVWYGSSPINCAKHELHERVPQEVRLDRLNSFLFDEKESEKEFDEWWRASDYSLNNSNVVDCRGVKELAKDAWEAARR